jgi:acyl-CoA synthetase (AMP-forming)/AMP-acid ligase II/thioesterase domain-containing protein
MLMEDLAVEARPRIARTIAEAIAAHAAAAPQAPAIVLPDRVVLTYAMVQDQFAAIAAELRRAGIGAGDRVAVIVPHGAELAIAMTGIGCCATIMPLNPALTAAEIADLFAVQRPDAVVLADWIDTAAREVAARLGLCRLEASRARGGIALALRTPPLPPAAVPREVAAEDAFCILRTSGTTARSKLVALSHRNLLAMMGSLEGWFGLAPSDRVLCAMPLYYAQGVTNALLPALALGGSLACPAQPAAADYLAWFSELAPTWYSAGPTMHRAVLDAARAWQGGPFRHSLRFIQSASAPLPEAVRDGLQNFFDVPELDSYGMSEAGLIAANGVAPEERKLGTVGRAWRDDLVIRARAADGTLLMPGEIGEIVLRGPAVTPGYVGDADANRAAFADGWFLTGDLGHVDGEGYVTIVGRIKELINRGGEKISPAEVDQALMRHPAVAEAATFPVPHPRLGEDAAAAVVLRAGATASPLELRRFLRDILVPFKIPRRIHLVAALPKGDTGKVLRRKLTASLGTAPAEAPMTAWRSSLEIELADIWRLLLDRRAVGRDDEFFELGGDSLLAAQMLLEVERLTGRSLPADILFETATIRQLAESVVESDAAAGQGLLVTLQEGAAGRTPFIFIDGDFWGGGYYARTIARLMGPEQPFYHLRSHALQGESIPSVEAMAADYRSLIAAVRPHGPYRLGGHCNGALIAWELARQFVASGEPVELVAMIDPITVNARPAIQRLAGAASGLLTLLPGDRGRRDARLTGAMVLAWRVIGLADKLLHERAAAGTTGGAVDAFGIGARDPHAPRRYLRLQQEYRRVMAAYFPPPVAVNALCLIAASHGRGAYFAAAPWRPLAPRLDVETVPGEHLTCITTHAEVLTARLLAHLAVLDADGAAPAAARGRQIDSVPISALRAAARISWQILTS